MYSGCIIIPGNLQATHVNNFRESGLLDLVSSRVRKDVLEWIRRYQSENEKKEN